MTQSDRWDKHWNEIMDYMKTFKRRPSKHRLEDHRMLNWLKYNKKLMASGKLSPDHQKRLNKLLLVAIKYQRINQYAYVNKPTARQLSLFPAD